jgi:N4-gp56 family major capsid protein
MATAPHYSKLESAAEDIATDLNRYSDTQDATLRAALGGVSVTNELSPRTLMYAEAVMLKHAEPILILEKFAQTKPMPANKSQTIKFRRAVPLKPATTPLVEGVTPDAQKMSYEDVETSLKQYGAWMGLTDVIADTHEDPILRDMSTLCGEQAAETKELLMWGVVTGGTNVYLSNGAAAAALPTDLNKDMREIVKLLRRQRAKPITKILAPSPNIATKYVEAGYVFVGHTDLAPLLRDAKGFIPVAGYGQRQPLSPYEEGTIENMRFILSPMYEPTAGGVYKSVIFAEDCFATVPLKGKDSVKSYVLNPGVARGTDPLGQRGTIGWKTWFAALILNQAWLMRYECKIA